MPKATLAGHPLHPQLITLPLGMFPFSLVMDVMHQKTGERSYADAAYYSLLGGFIGGLAAGAAGAADYFTIPSSSKAKPTANLHAALNLGILGLTAVNLLLRKDGRKRRTGGWPLALSAVANAGALVSSWYGGHLVYEHGLRVKGVDSIAAAPELKPPGDEALAHTFERLGAVAAPVEGPVVH
jgi:uncharacterized membrane protein